MSSVLRHLSAYLAETAARHAGRPAVVDADGTVVTYGDLDEAVRRVAGHLATHGIGVGDRVGVMMPKSIEAVTAIYGVLTCGAAYVPLDPSAPPERGGIILDDCGVEALFVHESVASLLDRWEPRVRPRAVVVVGDGARPRGSIRWKEAVGCQPMDLTDPPSVDTLAYVLYTSGSTGTPKGVPISHRNASSFVEWGFETFQPVPDDRFASHAPFHFDLSAFDLHVGIKAGASVHLITDEVSRNPRQLAKFVAERDISIWYSTPSALSLLAQYGRLDRLDYRGPRIGLFAGEVFPVKHLRSMTRLWPESQWYNLYGPTETNVCTYFRIPLPVPAERVEPYPIGTPCAHCEALVLGESGSPGAEGLLLIRGDSVFQGYWNRPEETAKAFRDIEGQRWYNTGDVVRPDEDGNLGFHGRRDRMVKRRGYRIELGEVESALYRHPSLDKIGVVALSEDTGVRIVACYSPSGACPSIVELKQFASQILPSYMVPDAFACFDQLPSTSTGKVDYQRLMDCITHGGTEES